jgi:hypothetical protein
MAGGAPIILIVLNFFLTRLVLMVDQIYDVLA